MRNVRPHWKKDSNGTGSCIGNAIAGGNDSCDHTDRRPDKESPAGPPTVGERGRRKASTPTAKRTTVQGDDPIRAPNGPGQRLVRSISNDSAHSLLLHVADASNGGAGAGRALPRAGKSRSGERQQGRSGEMPESSSSELQESSPSRACVWRTSMGASPRSGVGGGGRHRPSCSQRSEPWPTAGISRWALSARARGGYGPGAP